MSYNLNILGDDTAGVDVIGTSGAPAALTGVDTYVVQPGLTDVLNYRQATWYPFISAIGTATKITVKIEWSEDATNLAQQGFESIAADVATVSSGIWEYTAVAGALEPIPLPVIAPNAKVSIKADIGTTTTCYVRVARQA
jgi:hypothetical protein